MPTTTDRMGRVARARDLQVTRGEALREGVTVEVLPTSAGAPSHELAETDLLASARRLLATGQRIDVLWTPFIDLGDLDAGGNLAAVGGYAARDRLDLKAYMPQALQPAYSPTRGLLALPEEVQARQTYFRLDFLAEAGTDFRRAGLDFERPAFTWEALRRVALDAAAAPAGRARLAFDPSSDTMPFAAWAWQAGATVARPLPRDHGAIRDALAWLGSVATEMGLGPGRKAPAKAVVSRSGFAGDVPEGVAIEADDLGRHPVVSGRQALMFDSTRLVSAIASREPDAPIRVVELPRRDARARAVGWSEVSGYALLAGSSDDGWDLLKYLTSEDAAYASARAVAMRLPVIERPGPDARAPQDLPGGPRRWFPPCSGRLALDRFLSRLYRTGVKVLDEAHDHGLEQVRHVGTIPFGVRTRAWVDALERARRAVVREGADPGEAARVVITSA